ncbi:hypothetical protein BKA70DRAFT_502588 [Coprinopsis sp. MPI-PUGE-AT-0042]|nr:hypothetical protein BKA70DRAFT_502588 [Coprinopsis sp. MPI-PUGE-AT-0042]
MPQLRLRKARRTGGRSRAAIPSARPTAFEGARNVQINDGHLSVVGGDVHNHYNHLSGTHVDTLEVALSLVPNFRKIQQDTLAKAAPGTLAWLLKSDYLRVWRDPNGVPRIIWASGIAGAGKTVLA